MNPRHLLTLAAGLALTVPLAGPAALASATGPAGATAPADWTAPTCKTVDSDGSLTYTRNAGKKLRATTGAMAPVRYQFSVAALTTPNALLSGDQSGRLFSSADAGCTWTQGATLPDMDIPQIEPAPDGSAYVWSINTSHLVRVVEGAVTPLPDLPTGGSSVVELRVDPADASHVRAVTDASVVLDSTDGGQSFARVGTPVAGAYLYHASVDVNDFSHIAVGTMANGVWVTTDDAATWTKASIGEPGDRVNGFITEISPADGRTVYVQGLNITESDRGAPSQGRHVYQSLDGGLTFVPIVDQGPGVTLPNGTWLFPHPKRAGKVYFVFGMSYGGYGTDFFTYNSRKGELTMNHNSYDDIKGMAFNPAKPRFIYLGLADEPSGG